MAYYKKKQHTDGEDKIDKILYNRVLDKKKKKTSFFNLHFNLQTRWPSHQTTNEINDSFSTINYLSTQ